MKIVENTIIKIRFSEISLYNALIWYLTKQESMIIELATFQIAVSSSFCGAYQWSQERKMISLLKYLMSRHKTFTNIVFNKPC